MAYFVVKPAEKNGRATPTPISNGDHRGDIFGPPDRQWGRAPGAPPLGLGPPFLGWEDRTTGTASESFFTGDEGARRVGDGLFDRAARVAEVPAMAAMLVTEALEKDPADVLREVIQGPVMRGRYTRSWRICSRRW